MATQKPITRRCAPETPTELTNRLLAPFFRSGGGEAQASASPDKPKTSPSPAAAARVLECA